MPIKTGYFIYADCLTEEEFFEYIGMIGGFIVTQKFESAILNVHKKIFEVGLTQLTGREKKALLEALDEVKKAFDAGGTNLDLMRIGAAGFINDFKNSNHDY